MNIETWQIVSGLLTLVLGAAWGNYVSGKKVRVDDKHELINQLQEEREADRKKMAAMQKQIDELYSSFRKLEQDYGEVIHDNRKLKWELELKDDELGRKDKAIEKKDGIIETLRGKVKNLEQRVAELERSK